MSLVQCLYIRTTTNKSTIWVYVTDFLSRTQGDNGLPILEKRFVRAFLSIINGSVPPKLRRAETIVFICHCMAINNSHFEFVVMARVSTLYFTNMPQWRTTQIIIKLKYF